ncbi:UPF0287-domain-containing protein [Phlegmacium glaucopus]|nr:UPF0287-domain-containing protein [Phlegmacium glaucopus]
MHPQLSDKKLVCREFIEALEECHASGWKKFFGGCNVQKDQLNHCLRIERIARTTENRTASKERNSRTDQALREFREAS